MDGRWLKIIIGFGLLAFASVSTVIINNKRTTFGEMYVQELLKEISGLELISLEMHDETSSAGFRLSSEFIADVNPDDNIKELEELLYKVYCEQNIAQAQKLKITHFHANIYSEKHELILSRIVSPKQCT